LYAYIRPLDERSGLMLKVKPYMQETLPSAVPTLLLYLLPFFELKPLDRLLPKKLPIWTARYS
jgi:hypothetical protein